MTDSAEMRDLQMMELLAIEVGIGVGGTGERVVVDLDLVEKLPVQVGGKFSAFSWVE
jgi:hypothetical protein